MGILTLEAVLKKGNNLIPYYTFGDPSVASTEAIIRESIQNGADVIELGIPFSDPIADGPVIQASHQRALNSGESVSLAAALALVQKIKAAFQTPLILMSDVNLVYQFGIDSFFKAAKEHQLDGIIIPNLNVEASDAYQKAAAENDIALILLVSPLCLETRMQKIVKASTGFVYLMGSVGTTGERHSVSSALPDLAQKIREIKDIPVVVGFGISQPDQLKEVCSFANGGIVGSHLVKEVATAQGSIAELAAKIGARIKAFKS